MFAAQAEADIIFRQKHAAKMFPEFRLVVAHPEELCEGEVGQRWIAGELDDFALAELRVQPVALRLRALVAPDQRGPEHFVSFVEQNGAVHLTCESGADHVRIGNIGQSSANG